MDNLIVSMTTIPSRFKRLEENLPSLLEYQTYKVEKLRINLDDCLSEEQLKPYKELQEKYHQIELGTGEKRWRSCNKLLPTLKDYPDAVIITVDDDLYYAKDSIKTLVDKHNEFPNHIIAQESNPCVVVNGKFKFLMSYDIMADGFDSHSKILSNCCLWPPHIFEGSDVFNWDIMKSYTDGLDDELHLWLQATLNGVRCISLNYYHSLAPEVKTPVKEDEYSLTESNKKQEFINWKCDKINEYCGDKLVKILEEDPPRFVVKNETFYTYMYLRNYLFYLYPNCIVKASEDMTRSWKELLEASFNNRNYII